MEELGKKAGYLKGLLENTDLSADPALEKLFKAMTDLICESADRVASLEDLMEDLNDYVESIDDDLSALEGEHEDLPFGDDEDDDFGMYFDDDDPEAESKLRVLENKNKEDRTVPFKKANEDETVEVFEEREMSGRICPECGKLFFVDAGDRASCRYICPHCGKRVRGQQLTPENAPFAEPVK